MANIATSLGIDKVIGFDMGGTSTDVSHFAGSYERSFDKIVAGVRLRAPMMDIHTVAAGGGSQCVFDGLRFRVGPESAGASPGPAAYRQGGPLTITDCNVLLGRIQPKHFPSVFGKDASQMLDSQIVRKVFDALAAETTKILGEVKTPEDLAEGFLSIAIENMANAIKTISIQRGHDISTYTLVCFGGAGGQHACRVADTLGMNRVLIHPLAGVLSAYGMGLADLRVLKERTIALPLDQLNFDAITEVLRDLSTQAITGLREQGVTPTDIKVIELLNIRYEGSDATIHVAAFPLESAHTAFATQHRELFGFIQEDKNLVVESTSVEAIGGGATAEDSAFRIA